MYCLNAFKSLIQRKAKVKISVCDHVRPWKSMPTNKDNTNQHILHWIAVLSKLFENVLDNLPDF